MMKTILALTPYQKIRERTEVTGRCVSCKRHALPGNIRCLVHVEANRARSMAWRLKHPTARAELKAEVRAQGRCDLCPEKRLLKGDAKHCEDCLARFRGYYETRKAEGLCVVNGCNRKASGGVMCPTCRERTNEYVRHQRFVENGNQLQVAPGVVLRF